MKEVTLTLKVITPVIMSGSDTQNVEIRTQSIKGILRWWYRFWKIAEVNSISELKNIENQILGSQKNASKIRLKIESSSILSPSQNNQNQITDAYLCMNDSRSNCNKPYNRIKRKAVKENNTFDLKVCFSIPVIENDFYKTFNFLHYFGGIGARWRRGFGSIILEKSEKMEELSQLTENFKNIKTSFKNNSQNGINDYMNILNTSIYLIYPINNPWRTWNEAMDNLRDNFYRKLKNHINIGYIKHKRSSPLIIQIKLSGDNKYYGVLLVWEKWDKYNDFRDFLNTNGRSFNIQEVI